MRNALDDLNRTGVKFLITDVDLALTFLAVAAASHSEDAKRRNHKNARRAYDTVLALLLKVNTSEAERQTIKEKMALLKERLRVVGERF